MRHIITDDRLFLILKVYRELLNRPKIQLLSLYVLYELTQNRRSHKIGKTMSNKIFRRFQMFLYDFELCFDLSLQAFNIMLSVRKMINKHIFILSK